MNDRYEALFSSMRVGSLSVKNRIVMCAMEGTNLIEGIPKYRFNEDCRDFYRERAKANVGLLIAGMVPVRGMIGRDWLYDHDDIFLGPVQELVEEMHSYGSRMFLQVGAGMGRVLAIGPRLQEMYSSKLKKAMARLAGFDLERVIAAPSGGLPNAWVPEIRSREMSRHEILDIIDAYARTAVLCKEAGIDGVEVHAVHEGYLLDQFSISSTNYRSDEFGGSIENRYRFATEIIKGIKSACGKDYPVVVRFSVTSKMRGFGLGALPGEDYVEFGRDREESVRGAQLLKEAGADALDADNGSYDAWFWAHPPMYMPLACNLEDVAYLKEHVDIPLFCAGRMEDPDIAAEAVRTGKIDGVGLARQLLADGQWCDKVRKGRTGDIRPCIACHNGCFAVSNFKGSVAVVDHKTLGRCALNPVTLNERKYEIKPVSVAKRVAVVGGGVAGMEVARLCALRGHRVTLYERSKELGGVLIAAASPSFKEKDRMLIAWYRKQIYDAGVDVRLNSEIKRDDIERLQADEIVVATGAKTRRLDVPGIDREQVMEATEYLLGTKRTGANIVIIGGGLTGCEIAYDLVLSGKKPIIVEMQDDILKIPSLSAANSNMLREIIRYQGIPVHLESKVAEIGESGVTVASACGKLATIAADSVVVSAGYVAGSELAVKDRDNIRVVGDAFKVGNLKAAIWQAYDLAFSI